MPIILITGKSSEAKAIAAIKAGANNYFKLPFSCEVVAKRVKRILQTKSHRSLSNEVLKQQSIIIDKYIIGQSKSMQKVKSYLLNVAQYNSTVLITGETGTGKELAANLIHLKNPRHKKSFVCVNYAALPESLVKSELFGHDQGAFTGWATMPSYSISASTNLKSKKRSYTPG